MHSTSAVYSVNHKARALCPQRASKESSRWITGTCSLHDENEVHLLEYREDSNQIDCISSYSLKDSSVFSIESSPDDLNLIISCNQNKISSQFSVSLIRIPDPENIDLNTSSSNSDSLELEEVSLFQGCDNSINSLAWLKQKNNVLLSSTNSISSWNITESTVSLVNKLTAEDGLDITTETNWFNGVSSWDPHSSNISAAVFNTSVHIIDWRRNEISLNIANAHKSTIRDVDWNPNKPKTIITCSDDRSVKFWDLRNLKEPIKTLNGHTHWVYCSKYNPFHDQLVISGGSDNLVNLWRITSCSSSPLLNDGDNSNKDDPMDIKVRSVDQHEDSIYSLAWSAADAWIYASLSYDGRIVANHVPSTEKYKILL